MNIIISLNPLTHHILTIGSLEDSHESNFQSMTGLLKVDLSPSHQTTTTTTSSLTSTHISTSSLGNYMPILPDMLPSPPPGNRNSTLDSTPPVPAPRQSLHISPR